MKRAWLALGLGVLAAWGCGGGRNPEEGNPLPSEDYVRSVNHIHALANAMAAYTNDWDDVYPPANRWMDALSPYVADQGVFVTPALVGFPNRYGYAFNAALAGLSTHQVMSPDSTVMLFDSTVLQRNATADVSSLPNPPRYGVSNTIAYASGRIQDGHLVDDGDNEPTSGEVAVSRMRSLSAGLAMYASDYDDYMPIHMNWVDGTRPYVADEVNYRSPALAADPNAYGFAFHTFVSARPLGSIEAPAETLSVFDSVLPGRNAFGLPDTLPNPARYREGNAKLFIDGHVAIDHNRP